VALLNQNTVFSTMQLRVVASIDNRVLLRDFLHAASRSEASAWCGLRR
jgi:hypothetical protein